MQKISSSQAIVIALAAIVLATATSVFAQWVGPTAAPPGNNVSAPLNVGATTQTKTGGLWADSMGTDNGYCIGVDCVTSWTDIGGAWLASGSNIYYGDGNVGIGTNDPGSRLTVAGEITSNNPNQFRMVWGNYGLFFRNDGTNTYLLHTDSGDQYGSWNALRPFRVNNATGDVALANSRVQVTHSTGNVITSGNVGATEYCDQNGANCTLAASLGGFIPVCQADMSNIQIGDTCDDGSKFLGSHPNFGWQGFYSTDVDQSTASNWSNSIALCDNLNRHGKTDWYLPVLSELNHLYEHRTAIGGFTTSYYWSSTEGDGHGEGTDGGGGSPWYQIFSNGTQGTASPSNNFDVRCVRRN